MEIILMKKWRVSSLIYIVINGLKLEQERIIASKTRNFR